MDRVIEHRNDEWAVTLGVFTGIPTAPLGILPMPTKRRAWFVRASDGREYYGHVHTALHLSDDDLRAALDEVLSRDAGRHKNES